MNTPVTRRYSLRLASKAHSAAIRCAATAESIDTPNRITRSQSHDGRVSGAARRSARLAAKPRISYAGMDCDE